MGARQLNSPASLSESLNEITNLLIDIEEMIHEEKIAKNNKERIIWHIEKAHHLVGSPCER